MSDKLNEGTEADVEKNVYEIGFHLVPSVPEEKIGAEVSLIKDVLEKNGAVVIGEELPKLKTLAYEIRKSIAGRYQKFLRAYFGSIKFEVGSDGVSPIKEALDKNDTILRFLLIGTVRENTMTVPRIPSFRRSDADKDVKKDDKAQPEKPAMTEVELDKTIEALVAE